MTDQITSLLPWNSYCLSRFRPSRMYVAWLAAHNGRLHGAWIEATTPDEIRAGSAR